MSSNQMPVPGWVGTFAQSKDAFAYPIPDLSSLPMLDNMLNIDKLERQQGVEWPEFSWETEKDLSDTKRCFQTFVPYISRIGYTNEGRVYSIICPQQGMWLKDKLCLNVEVTVTGQRGWIDEANQQLSADMTVEGKVWFSPKQGVEGKLIWVLLERMHHTFPLTKETAIRVSTHHRNKPDTPIFPVKYGESDLFESPAFARHPESWGVGNLEVEIGSIVKTNDKVVDDFNKIIMKAFNIATGNMLQQGNVLTWNVWFNAPDYVDKVEWKNHAKLWRASIDANHGPVGGTPARFYDGTPFSPKDEVIEEVLSDITAHVSKIPKSVIKEFTYYFKKSVKRFFG